MKKLLIIGALMLIAGYNCLSKVYGLDTDTVTAVYWLGVAIYWASNLFEGIKKK